MKTQARKKRNKMPGTPKCVPKAQTTTLETLARKIMQGW